MLDHGNGDVFETATGLARALPHQTERGVAAVGQDEAMTWISDVTTRIAVATGIDAAPLTIDAAEAEELLRLAGVAAHTSGDRTNAPLLCHVLGRAVALGAPLAMLAEVVDDSRGA